MLGNFVLMMAARAAYTCVKVGEAVWAWMTDWTSRPRPRTMFSAKSSRTMTAMFGELTWYNDLFLKLLGIMDDKMMINKLPLLKNF